MIKIPSSIIIGDALQGIGGKMSDEEKDSIPMAECGSCRALIPLDSTECPECNTQFSGVSEEALGECGACNALVPLDSTRCPECDVVFVADDVVDILRKWVHDTGIQIRKLFEKFDTNSDGMIDASELKAGLLSLNLADLPPSQVDRLVKEIDADDNGVIDLDEFETILHGDTDHHDAHSDEHIEAEMDEEEAESDEEVEEVAEDSEEEVVLKHEAPESQEDHTSESDEVDHSSEDLDDSDEGATQAEMDEEDFDIDEDSDENIDVESPLHALVALMEEHDISAQRMFNDLDKDGNRQVSMEELRSSLTNDYEGEFDGEDLEALIEQIDSDNDGMIDITEFIGAIEEMDDEVESIIEKPFPTPMQKRMMSKQWNDIVWPILHTAFGIAIAILLVNGLIGPVDGSGGTVFYEPNNVVPPFDIAEGDPYPCDVKYQEGGCDNSLTPFAGDSSSMPKGFYWDGILFILLSVMGMISSLFLHLIKAPSWRARAKAMKEVEDDRADATQSGVEEEESDDPDDDEEHEEDHEDYEEEDVEESEDDQEDSEDDDEDDEIDIGSHVGLLFDDEEVFGTIIEFDDDEGTVTIEEDGTGDLVTGYQDDMFIE